MHLWLNGIEVSINDFLLFQAMPAFLEQMQIENGEENDNMGSAGNEVHVESTTLVKLNPLIHPTEIQKYIYTISNKGIII